jgi:hypothetical protein
MSARNASRWDRGLFPARRVSRLPSLDVQSKGDTLGRRPTPSHLLTDRPPRYRNLPEQPGPLVERAGELHDMCERLLRPTSCSANAPSTPHVDHIRAKLSVRTRSQIAAWVVGSR